MLRLEMKTLPKASREIRVVPFAGYTAKTLIYNKFLTAHQIDFRTKTMILNEILTLFKNMRSSFNRTWASNCGLHGPKTFLVRKWFSGLGIFHGL
jgi:hypothetical protein